jgi:hypothetical protein
MPLVQTRGAASAQGFGEFAQAATAANYIEDVFSTYLYTGTGAAQTITNGIDLAGKGGMVWTKQRSSTRSNNIVDTVRGGDNMVYTNATDAQFSLTGLGFSAFTFSSTGFVASNAPVNAENATTFCSWTFREQAKFFDVVTWTGNGVAGRTILHNLGSTPGMIIVKTTSNVKNWAVWHRAANSGDAYAYLNTTDAFNNNGGAFWGTGPFGSYVAPTSTNFTVSDGDEVNKNGWTYVAYVFAHDAGGFGTTGTDNVISCGSFVTTAGGAVPTVTLGYEPQYLMFKCSSSAGNWNVIDNMRAFSQTQTLELFPNATTAETDYGVVARPSATGFTSGDEVLAGSETFIYMAIRRPMKVPTDATTVFNVTSGNFSTPYTVTTGFPVDLCYSTRTGGSARHFNDRLRGPTSSTSYNYLNTASTASESAGSGFGIGFQSNTSIIDNDWVTGANAVWWSFRRAPGFFDQICYTGTGSTATDFSHNLGVVPELIIFKRRAGTVTDWGVWRTAVGTSSTWAILNSTAAESNQGVELLSSTPTSTKMNLSTWNGNNQSTQLYTAYLFATCAGVSKVGTYTGNGTSQAIACGFTGGARFVLIKRTDGTGGWYIYDTARGMTSGTDPYLFANTSSAQTATLGSVTTTTGGFTVDATVLAAINTNAASYIFLAIA